MVLSSQSLFDGRWPSLCLKAALIAGAAGFILCAAAPSDVSSETYLAITFVALIAVLSRWTRPGITRTVMLFLCLMLNIRYLSWRISDTIEFYDPISFAAALILLTVELYAFAIMLLGLFVNASPLKRVLPSGSLGPDAPRVDILVPTYNEPPEMLAITVAAATQVSYPEGRCRVHLLDDGGTDQKLHDPDPARARAAASRAEELRQICVRFGAHYLTRPRNLEAKAGNINEALPRLDGDLILVLDADHVPTRDILERTVPLFQGDPKLFLVQTPHFLINPDTIEKNLGIFMRMPGENQMFHRAIQSGLDFWQAALFCGSAAILDRHLLLESGGVSTSTVTEDAETALKLHAKGYRSAFIGRPLVAGLAPETFTGFVTQRARWAQGMLQILLLLNPLRAKNLTIPQRIGYVACASYWLFPFARVVFLLAPTAFLLFGLRIYAANLDGFLIFVVPHMFASAVSSNALFGRVRWPGISHIYETMQGLLLLVPLARTLRHPRAPTFQVTPKGEHLSEDFISPLVRPFYAVLVIVLCATVGGIIRLGGDPAYRGIVLVTLGWNTLNALLLWMVLGALFERRQRRSAPRMACDIPALLTVDGRSVAGTMIDVSIGGGSFAATKDLRNGHQTPLPLGAGRIELTVPHMGGSLGLDVELRASRADMTCGLAFSATNRFEQIVALVYGDSERWVQSWSESTRSTTMLLASTILLRQGFRAVWSHIAFVASHAASRCHAAALRRFRRPAIPSTIQKEHDGFVQHHAI